MIPNPWVILIALLALIGISAEMYHSGHMAGVQQQQAADAPGLLAASQAVADAQAKAREIEQAHVAHIAAIQQQAQQDREADHVQAQSTIDDLRAGTLRLRSQLAAMPRASACPSATTGPDSSGTPTGSTPGLSETDGEFLIRESERADQVGKLLQECIATLKDDRAL